MKRSWKNFYEQRLFWAAMELKLVDKVDQVEAEAAEAKKALVEA